jgi:hypothetical protein
MDSMLITTISSCVTAIGGFIYGLKKQKQDLVTTSLDNLQKQLLIYETIIENLRGEITVLIAKVEKQQEIINHLEKKMEECISPKTNL